MFFDLILGCVLGGYLEVWEAENKTTISFFSRISCGI